MSKQSRPDNTDEFDKQLEDFNAAVPNSEDPSNIDASVESQAEGARKVLGLIHRVRKSSESAVKQGSAQSETVRQQVTAKDELRLPFSNTISEKATGSTKATETRKIDRFVVKRQLGQGGYGLVFLARDPQLDRDVALKVPRPEVIVTPELRSRFLREAKAAGSLSHPNIVPVFESGDAGPICFIAYELIPGITLAQWLKESSISELDLRDAASLVSILAEAVHHAHQRGVLHRDLKPANILLRPNTSELIGKDNNQGGASNAVQLADRKTNANGTLQSFNLKSAMITDFGMAKIIESGDMATKNDDQTRTGAIIGTPAYMSPEQIRTGSQPVDARSDIYSLGAILYELLTGQPPFQAATVIETLQKVQKSEPLSPGRLNRNVPSDLSAICLRCLEKSPSARYDSAHDLKADLDRFLEGRAVVARPVSSLNKLRKWYQRNPLLASSVTTAVAAIIIGLIAVSALWLRSDQLRSQAESRGIALAERQRQLETKTSQLESKTEQLNAAIRGLFLEVAKSEEIKSPEAAALRQALLERANQFYVSFIAERPDDEALRIDRAQTLYELAKIHEYLGDPEGSLELVRQAIDENTVVSESLSNQLALITWHKYAATRLNQMGRILEAEQETANAMELVNSAQLNPQSPHQELPRWDRIRASLLTDQAELRIVEKDMQTALELTDHALKIFDTLEIEAGPTWTTEELYDKALCYRIRGRAFGGLEQLDKNEESLNTAVDILRGLTENEFHFHCNIHLKLGQCLYEKGVSHSRQNELDLARACYSQALEQYDSLPDTLDVQLIKEEEYHRVAYSLAVADMLSGNFVEAEATILNCVTPIKKIIEKVPQERASLFDALGDNFNLLYVIRVRSPDKTNEDAEQAIRQAIGYYQQSLAERSDWVEPQMALVQSQTNLGNNLLRQDKIEQAIEQYDIADAKLAELQQSRPDWSKVRQGKCNVLYGKMDANVKQAEFEDALLLCREAQTFLAPNAINHILLDESWILANLNEFGAASNCLESFADVARQPQDYIAVARKAIEIHELTLNSSSDTDFRDLAVSFLNQGLPADAEKQKRFVDQIKNDERISELAPKIGQQ